ncbi:MAG TPA: ABC transporter ATP-binding protein [Clostridiaceae bacterium]|nr:ABC transporter ATP-binding protein [Clostridiaceae bacterium]
MKAVSKIAPDCDQKLMQVQNVSFFYPPRSRKHKPILALKNIEFTINPGEFICLMGPSGCGKTSLLRLMAGYVFPSEGQILWCGNQIEGPSVERGVIFQQPNLYPWLSCSDNIAFGPHMAKLPEDEVQETVERLLRAVYLQDFHDALPHELSGGMKQRCSLARSLATEPQLLLMDEPFGALDAMTRWEMQSLIRKLSIETITTIFMITHDIDEGLALADRIFVMSELPGQIIREFKVDFSAQAVANQSDRVEINAEYLSLREEIVNLLT